ncbi:A24 family peptidase [Brevundimonas sp.]|uniref:prepilin peptidase n=1 Tax=Brevundimonas sp. TaxID=1871086 RepID=UPI0034519F6E
MAGAVLAWQLLLIAIIDAEHFWLPDVLTLPLLGTGLAAAALIEPHLLVDRLIGAVAGFVSLWLVALLYRSLRGREGLGGGDPRLFAGIGAWVGWAALPTVLVWACLAGLSVALVGAARVRRLDLIQRLPFGTFLAIGAWLAWLFGPLGRSGL